MKRVMLTAAIACVVATSVVATEDRLDFQYNLKVRKADGPTGEASPPVALASEDRFKVRVKPRQAIYFYLLASGNDGDYRLVFPNADDADARTTTRVSRGAWSELPGGDAWMQLDTDSGAERLMLIAALDRIPEVEDLLKGGKKRVPEMVALQIRDRYISTGLYTREFDDDLVSVTYRNRGRTPGVWVEEISFRHKK